MIQSLAKLRREFLDHDRAFFEFPDDDPRKAHPLSLHRQQMRPEELMHSQNPDCGGVARSEFTMADAQQLIAQEAGFSTWEAMQLHIEAVESARSALVSGRPSALDGDKRTLHIRCGNDVMPKLAVSGFSGDFLSFADPYIQGPVAATESLELFLRQRAEFINRNRWRSMAQAYRELAEDYQALERGREYERINIWLEHDAYDVLVFLKLLHFFSEREKRAPEMRYICIDRYPGVARFNGIGQLPADAMRVLWRRFNDLKEEQFQFGRECWQAYTASTPEALCRLAMADGVPLPEIIPALRRHLQELPWRSDGLSLSERLTLTILHEQGAQSAADLFYHWYTCRYEPLVFMGDSSYWLVLEGLADAKSPAIVMEKGSEKPIDWRVSLTDFGRRLLAGEAHWLDANDYDRWFGGVHNCSEGVIWLWDEAAQRVVVAEK
jgi:hypothetical protein